MHSLSSCIYFPHLYTCANQLKTSKGHLSSTTTYFLDDNIVFHIGFHPYQLHHWNGSRLCEWTSRDLRSYGAASRWSITVGEWDRIAVSYSRIGLQSECYESRDETRTIPGDWISKIVRRDAGRIINLIGNSPSLFVDFCRGRPADSNSYTCLWTSLRLRSETIRRQRPHERSPAAAAHRALRAAERPSGRPGHGN